MADREPNGRWLKGGRSPNPGGRPRSKGWSGSFRDLINEEDLEKLAEKVVDMAANGDLKAIELVMRYTIAVPSDHHVFDLPVGVPIEKQFDAIIQAMSNGQLPISSGTQLLTTLVRTHELKMLDELRREAAEIGVEENRLVGMRESIQALQEKLRARGYQ